MCLLVMSNKKAKHFGHRKSWIIYVLNRPVHVFHVTLIQAAMKSYINFKWWFEGCCNALAFDFTSLNYKNVFVALEC